MLSVILNSRFYLCVLQRSFGRGAQRPGCTEPPCPTPQQPRRARTTPTPGRGSPSSGSACRWVGASLMDGTKDQEGGEPCWPPWLGGLRDAGPAQL